MDAPCSPATLYAWISDLGTYPRWLGIVPRAVPLDDGGAPDAAPAWQVDLRGSIGPLARSKRLRMVRTQHEHDRCVLFERVELDGHAHGRWELRAEITPGGETSHLEMDLRYEGRFATGLFDRLLRDEIQRSRPRLIELVAAGPPSTS
jgi:hypothetical protein